MSFKLPVSFVRLSIPFVRLSSIPISEPLHKVILPWTSQFNLPLDLRSPDKTCYAVSPKSYKTPVVLDVNEAYTSKTVSWTGEIVKNLGGSKTIKSLSTGKTMDRDLNGARGIFLRALVDTPWLRENLSLCIC
jgi:hypothetical protein